MRNLKVKLLGIPNKQLGEAIRFFAVAIPLLALLTTAPNKIPLLFLVFVIVMGWHWLFARKRLGSPGIDLLITVLLFTLLSPDTITWWQLIMSVSFGVVLGEQIYGGRGYSFINPVVAGLAFGFYSFELGNSDSVNSIPLWAVLPSLGLLLGFKLLDWRVVGGALAGIGTLLLIITGSVISSTLLEGAPNSLPSMAVAACLLFAAGDTAICPATKLGRWLYGTLLGALTILLDSTLSVLEQAVFASLLASVAMPLTDWICVASGSALSQAKHAGAPDA